MLLKGLKGPAMRPFQHSVFGLPCPWAGAGVWRNPGRDCSLPAGLSYGAGTGPKVAHAEKSMALVARTLT